MTKQRRYKRYSPEFKREALKRASEDGVTDILICEELGISTRQLRRWRDEFRLLGDDAFPGQGRSRDEEITRLKRDLAKAQQERDFLKEAAVGMPPSTLPRSRSEIHMY
jgi:transposase